MQATPCGDSRLQPHQQQEGKEQRVLVNERQNGQSGKTLFHEARRIFVNAVAGRTSSASASGLLPAAPSWANSPLSPSSANTCFAVDSAVTAALAPADAGAGTGVTTSRSCKSSNGSSLESPCSPVVDTRACGTSSPLTKKKSLQGGAPIAAVPPLAATTGGPAGLAAYKREKKGKRGTLCPEGEGRATYVRKSSSGTVTMKSRDVTSHGAGADRSQTAGIRKRDDTLFFPPECRKTTQGKEVGRGVSTSSSTNNHSMTKDPYTSKGLGRFLRGKASATSFSGSTETTRAHSGILFSRRPTGGDIHQQNSFSKIYQQKQKPTLQEKHLQKTEDVNQQQSRQQLEHHDYIKEDQQRQRENLPQEKQPNGPNFLQEKQLQHGVPLQKKQLQEEEDEGHVSEGEFREEEVAEAKGEEVHLLQERGNSQDPQMQNKLLHEDYEQQQQNNSVLHGEVWKNVPTYLHTLDGSIHQKEQKQQPEHQSPQKDKKQRPQQQKQEQQQEQQQQEQQQREQQQQQQPHQQQEEQGQHKEEHQEGQQKEQQEEQDQMEEQEQQRQGGGICEWGDRTEEKKILEAFPDLMGAELLRELPLFLQQGKKQQKYGNQDVHLEPKDTSVEGICIFRLWGPHVEKCWVQIGCGAEAAEVGQKKETETRMGETQTRAGETETPPLLFEMLCEGNEKWGTVLRGVRQGTPYEFVLQSSWNDCYATEGYHLHRRDPYAREVDFDSTTCFVVDPSSFCWKFPAPASVTWNSLIIYELHPGTFVSSEEEGKTVFEKLVEKLDYIKEMNFNAVELLPIQEFGGAWGYNPRLLMAPHGRYGTAQQLRQLVDECHRRGLAVLFDVVLNHGSAKMNSLWNWDGYGKDNSGGIYFEGGGDTGWGRKFALQKPQVRQMVLHAAVRFIDEYKVDGLRVDSVHNMPWDFLCEMTRFLHEKYPKHIIIAEITPENPKVCIEGAGFDSCWIHSTYYDSVKITRGQDSAYHMDMLRAMIDVHRGFSRSHQCVNSILGSHDQVGNKQQGFMSNNNSGRYAVSLYGGRNNWHSRAQCRMWYSLQATSRGLPMLFMGTETLQDSWWNVDPAHVFNWQLIKGGDVFSRQMRSLVTAANELRLRHPSLINDDTCVHFPHVDSHNRVLGFTRGNLLMVLNVSENQWDEASYQVNTDWREGGFVQLFNSQAEEFGGWTGSWTKKNNEKIYSSAAGKLAVRLPKWSVTVYEKQ